MPSEEEGKALLRAARGRYTQRKVAELTGVDANKVWRWETSNPDHSVSVDQIQYLVGLGRNDRSARFAVLEAMAGTPTELQVVEQEPELSEIVAALRRAKESGDWDYIKGVVRSALGPHLGREQRATGT